MRILRLGRFAPTLGLLAAAACGGDAGREGSEILAPYDTLPGGMVFATAALQGSDGYDLYWAPVPAAVTLDAQPVTRLTDTGGNEWQPSVSPGGNGIAFVRLDDGIHFITTSGRVVRISDTRDTDFKDSLPAVDFDGTRVAWVREDTARPIGETGFFETYIMVANADGTEARELSPVRGTVQDAPAFEPVRGGTRLAWSEFSAETLTQNGPRDYGVRVFDVRTTSDFYLCRSPAKVIDGAEFRCFGQHLAWPIEGAVVLPQSFMELYLDGRAPTQVLGNVLNSIQGQQLGAPILEPIPGFFAPFPLSASYLGQSRMIMDGLVTSTEGDLGGLGFFVAQVDGQSLWRLNLEGYRFDVDERNTAGYFFSVATPQLIPAIQAP